MAGFTLAEAVVALTLSGLVVVLVSTVFLVQNQYYAFQLKRASAQDNVRSVTELVTSDLRAVPRRGLTFAQSTRLVFRAPVALAAVCGAAGNETYVHVDGGVDGVPTDEVAGFAVRESLGEWSYYDVPWDDLESSAGAPPSACAASGADTAGAGHEFITLADLDQHHAVPPAVGDVLMLYRQTELVFAASELDPGSIALYRGPYGQTLVEFVTGMDSTSGFRYRVDGGTYLDSVAESLVHDVDAVRVDAMAVTPAETGGRDDITFGWSVAVPLGGGP